MPEGGGASVVPLERRFLTRFGGWLVTRDRRTKLVIALSADVLLLLACATLAILLIAGHIHLRPSALPTLLLLPFVTVVSLYVSGTYRAVIRYVDADFVGRCLYGLLLALGPLMVWAYIDKSQIASLRVLCAFMLLALASLSGVRWMARHLLKPDLPRGNRPRVMIYGAGDAGAQLAAARRLRGMYAPVGFVDDRSTLSGRTMMGLPIYRPEHLDDLRAHNIFDRILLAIPSLSRTRRRQILESLEKLAVKVLVVPSLDELASGDRNLHELREVQIEDLLDRDAVAPIDSLLDAYIRGKVVMITGAGGSIGSELCRQALKQGASKLVLYETGEYALYSIDRELRMNLESDQDCEIVPVLANVVDERRLSSVLREHAVETVYHAAAYKHVPLVEANVASAVNNNVFGTLRAVEAAVGCGVKNFVLVSTDKAVRPTNVMGASKRVCELIVQAFAGRYPQVRWSIVRFGNVLGSSGSVVPLFREQIAAGGPVTVTHPDVVRYFMTIPEAAQLVIQAGAMGRAGEVFVLDMGSPVRIAQLAERMVHLSGMQVRNGADGDVDIIYTGLRPGEKLYEELLIDQTARPSEHPRIYCADEAFLEMEVLRTWIETLEHLLIQDDSRAVVDHLGEVVDGFQHLARQRAEENLSEVRRLAGTRESAKLPTCGGVDLTTAHHAA